MKHPNVAIVSTFDGQWMLCRRLENQFPLPLVISPWRWALRLYAWWWETVRGQTIE